MGTVISHPRFAVAPVKNPPIRKGPKPKGTAGSMLRKGNAIGSAACACVSRNWRACTRES
jgi:hypothetical protein